LHRLLPQDAVHCGRELREIDVARKRLVFASGPDCSYESLVLSLPLPKIVELLVGAPSWLTRAASDLVFTSIHVVNVGVEGDLEAPGTILRFPESRVGFYRLSFPSRYAKSSAPEGCTSVVGELSHHPRRHPMTRLEARDIFFEGLAHLGIMGPGRKILAESIYTIPYGHVVYTHRTKDSVRRILEYLEGVSIYTCGKYGRWQDMLMTDSILSGMEVARQMGRWRTVTASA
jgi:protoporphyrinogen oxidase